MSDPRIKVGNAIMLIAVILLMSVRTAEGRDSACAQYYMARVGWLLGCCGDTGSDYPGPSFPGRLGEVERSTVALKEIDVALTKPCIESGSREKLSLILQSAGAHIMRANALIGDLDSPKDSILRAREALKDADTASEILNDFTNRHPQEAVQVWGWITIAYSRAGRPWAAVRFLSSLESKLPDHREADRITGDILFDLRNYQAAATAYGKWLEEGGPTSYCGAEGSIANVAILRARGFDLPAPHNQSAETCLPGLEWQPYVSLRSPNPEK